MTPRVRYTLQSALLGRTGNLQKVAAPPLLRDLLNKYLYPSERSTEKAIRGKGHSAPLWYREAVIPRLNDLDYDIGEIRGTLPAWRPIWRPGFFPAAKRPRPAINSSSLPQAPLPRGRGPTPASGTREDIISLKTEEP